MGSESASYWAEIQQYEEILGNNPASYCFVPLAELYRKMNLLDDALAIAEKGCDRYPDLVSGQLVLGKILLDRGLVSLARQALVAVVQAMPDCSEAQRLLGQLYLDDGEHEAARQALQIVKDLNPRDTECQLLLSSIPVRSTELEQAPAASPAAGVPPSVEEMEELEEIELVEELTDELVEDYEPVEAVPADTRSAPLTTATMAELYVQQGFVERAIGIYREILVDAPDNVTARHRLAELEASLAASAVSVAAPASPEPFAAVSALPRPADTPPAGGNEAIGTLQQWLTNIGRVREWRSRKV